MNAQQIIADPATEAKIATAVEYNEINSGNCIMVHSNSGEFALVQASRVAARKAQGWTECVSYATLVSLGIEGETSDDGRAEAAKIVAWMREQA